MGTRTENCHVFAAGKKRDKLIAFLSSNQITYDEAPMNRGSFRLNLSLSESKLPDLKGECRKLKLDIFKN